MIIGTSVEGLSRCRGTLPSPFVSVTHNEMKGLLHVFERGTEMSNRKKSNRRMPPLFLNRYQVRDALQIGLTQVDVVIKNGNLKSIKVGRSVRVYWKDLMEYAKDLRNSGLKERWEV